MQTLEITSAVYFSGDNVNSFNITLKIQHTYFHFKNLRNNGLLLIKHIRTVRNRPSTCYSRIQSLENVRQFPVK